MCDYFFYSFCFMLCLYISATIFSKPKRMCLENEWIVYLFERNTWYPNHYHTGQRSYVDWNYSSVAKKIYCKTATFTTCRIILRCRSYSAAAFTRRGTVIQYSRPTVLNNKHILWSALSTNDSFNELEWLRLRYSASVRYYTVDKRLYNPFYSSIPWSLRLNL